MSANDSIIPFSASNQPLFRLPQSLTPQPVLTKVELDYGFGGTHLVKGRKVANSPVPRVTYLVYRFALHPEREDRVAKDLAEMRQNGSLKLFASMATMPTIQDGLFKLPASLMLRSALPRKEFKEKYMEITGVGLPEQTYDVYLWWHENCMSSVRKDIAAMRESGALKLFEVSEPTVVPIKPRLDDDIEIPYE